MSLPRHYDCSAALDWHSASLGQRILKLRRDHGWTQRELARRSGVSDRTIARMEIDGGAGCSVRSARALALALGVTVAALIE